MATRQKGAPAPLKELYLSRKQGLSPLHALADPSQLTTLRLDASHLSDFRPLAQLPQLTTLTLYRCQSVGDLSAMLD